jgi:hypothetical protein
MPKLSIAAMLTVLYLFATVPFATITQRDPRRPAAAC